MVKQTDLLLEARQASHPEDLSPTAGHPVGGNAGHVGGVGNALLLLLPVTPTAYVFRERFGGYTRYNLEIDILHFSHTNHNGPYCRLQCFKF